MKYNIPVTFIKFGDWQYDTTLGKSIRERLSEFTVYCNVSDLSPDRSVALFGTVHEKRKVVRLLSKYIDDWDLIIIDGQHFKYEASLDFRRKQAIIVKETDA